MLGPIPEGYTPAFIPFAIFDEGHVGVALFMVLSGYLFARLLDGKQVAWGAFFYNRAARLLPLLLVAIALNGVMYVAKGWMTPGQFLATLPSGLLLPALPGGAWSITVEWHFYLMLPALLWLLAKGGPASLIAVVMAAIVTRAAFADSAAYLGYWTILGRLDQFAAGMLAWHCRGYFTGQRVLAIGLASTASLWLYDLYGGLQADLDGELPLYASVLMPTLLALGFSGLVAWYAKQTIPAGRISSFIEKAGEYSYSIYLLHVFFVFDLQNWLQSFITTSNFSAWLLIALLSFVAFVPIAGLSYRWIERPLLNRRRHYLFSPAPG